MQLHDTELFSLCLSTCHGDNYKNILSDGYIAELLKTTILIEKSYFHVKATLGLQKVSLT